MYCFKIELHLNKKKFNCNLKSNSSKNNFKNQFTNCKNSKKKI